MFPAGNRGTCPYWELPAWEAALGLLHSQLCTSEAPSSRCGQGKCSWVPSLHHRALVLWARELGTSPPKLPFACPHRGPCPHFHLGVLVSSACCSSLLRPDMWPYIPRAGPGGHPLHPGQSLGPTGGLQGKYLWLLVNRSPTRSCSRIPASWDCGWQGAG